MPGDGKSRPLGKGGSRDVEAQTTDLRRLHPQEDEPDRPLTPYEKRARYRRSPRRTRRVQRCVEVLNGFRCTSRPAAGADRCLLHAKPEPQ